jgi:hypothetical protein
MPPAATNNFISMFAKQSKMAVIRMRAGLAQYTKSICTELGQYRKVPDFVVRLTLNSLHCGMYNLSRT